MSCAEALCVPTKAGRVIAAGEADALRWVNRAAAERTAAAGISARRQGHRVPDRFGSGAVGSTRVRSETPRGAITLVTSLSPAGSAARNDSTEGKRVEGSSAI